MDKRTLLFVISLFATLFLVNLYFDNQYEEKMRKWQMQQQVKKQHQLHELESEIAEKTISADKLPIVSLYRNEEGTDFLIAGVRIGDTILTLSTDEAPADVIYIKTPSKKGTTPFYLDTKANKSGSPLLYQKSGAVPLEIGNAPDMGSDTLQLVFLNPKNIETPVQISLAELNDKILTLAQEKVDILKKDLNETPETFDLDRNGIFLIKSGTSYLPVAIFQGSDQKTIYLEDLADFPTKTATNDERTAGNDTYENNSKKKQRYFVLENEYQQLVFSNIGAALVEINLPFKSSKNGSSVVLPIEFDRELVADDPQNAYFPEKPYFTPGNSTSGSFVHNAQGSLGGYYPLLRRDLIEPDGQLAIKENPGYYALNTISKHPEVAELLYEVTYFDAHTIIFETQQQFRKITKTFSLPKEKDAPYVFDMTIKVEGDKKGLWVSSGVPEVELFSGSPAPTLKYRMTRRNKSEVAIIDLPKSVTTNSSIHPDWICNSNGFFGIIVDPLTEIAPGFRASLVPGEALPSRLVEIDRDQERFTASSMPGYMATMPLNPTKTTTKFRVFAGPFSDAILNRVDAAYTDTATGYNPDYIACQSDLGWFSFISEPFAKFLFIVMNFFHTLTGSWAFSIILLTVVLRAMMYPLNNWSTRSLLKMQEIAPKISAVQEKYKNDPKKAQAEVLQIYQTAKVNPISGCLPMLIQMPFLFGMFDLLKTTFELRGAGFIPGWIDNLTSPDVLFSWNTPIFFIGNQFHLLPVLLGLVMFLQQRMSAAQVNVNEMTEQQRQQRAMGTLMTVVFTAMFYHFPSGLNLYWLSSTLLGMLQQWWTQKLIHQEKTSQESPKKASSQ